MSTTIDSLVLDIQSSSTNAVAGLDALATSLEKIKKSTITNTAVKNLNALTDALKKMTTVSSNANKISSLADAMTKLKSVGSVGTGIKKLAESMQSLNGVNYTALSKAANSSALFERLAGSVGKLSTVKAGGLSTIVNSLLKLNDVTDSLNDETIGAFTKKVEKLIAVLTPLSEKMIPIQAGFRGINTAIKQTTVSVQEANTELNVNVFNLSNIINVIKEVANALSAVAQKLMEIIHTAAEWDGISTRFGKGFGEQAEETYAWIQRLNDEMGINVQQFMQYSSTYATMLTGFGVASKDASEMALGYMELTYDIWAGYNDIYKNFGDAADAVRSAIAGEVEPIRRAGFTIVEATLEQTAANHGLEISIENATEAQKSYLRYLTLVDQAHSQSLIGTYANELQTVEGLYRTLAQQMNSLKQAFGSLFLPILVQIIPWIQAFVELLTEAIHTIAGFFGINIQKVDFSNSGLKNMASDANSANKEIEKAEKSLKDLKNATIGIDELNIISPQSNSSVGGGNGSANDGFSGLDVDSLWDESIFDNIQSQVDGIKEKLKPILALVVTIGAVILAWKISERFITALDTVKLMLKAIAGQKGAGSALALLVSPKAADNVAKLAKVLKSTPIGAAILGSGSTSIVAALAAVAAVVAAILAVVGGLVLVYKNSENFRNGLIAIGDGLLWVFDKVGEKIGELGQWVREKTSEFIPAGVFDFLGAFELGIGDLLITAGGLALFGPWGLLIEGAVLAIKAVGYAASDSLKPVDLFGEGVSDVTEKKVAPFIEKMNDLDNTLKTLDWSNAIVTDSDVADIQAKLETITDTIINELDSDKNEALAKIDPLREAMSDERFASLQEKIEHSYATQKQTVIDGEARIKEILERASQEARALTDEEAEEINKIRENMTETGVKYLSESETESNLILQRLKDNASKLSAEQASQVIKNAWSAKNETIEAAEEQYKGILMEAQRMLDTGTISKDEYDEIVKAAEDTRDKTVSAAETQYNNIVETAKTKMGEYAKYIDEETGEIKSKWEVFCDDISKWWNETWTDIKEWWNKNIAPFFTKKFWEDKFDSISAAVDEKLAEVKKTLSEKWSEITDWFNSNVSNKLSYTQWKKKFNGMVTGLGSKLDEAWTKVKNFFSESEWKKKIDEAMKSVKDNFKMPTLPKIKLDVSYDTNVGKVKKAICEALGLDGWPNLKWSTYAKGGFPAMGQMFIAREAGPEMVGTIGSRSAVANNDQIVEAVSAGVYSAVVAAMSAANGGGTQAVNVYLDGKQITASVEKRQMERGATLMTGGMAYGY